MLVYILYLIAERASKVPERVVMLRPVPGELDLAVEGLPALLAHVLGLLDVHLVHVVLQLLLLPEAHRAHLALVVQLLRVLGRDVAGHEVERVLLLAERALGPGVGLAKVLPDGAGRAAQRALRTLAGVLRVDLHVVVEGQPDGAGPAAVDVAPVLLLGEAPPGAALAHVHLEALLVAHEGVAQAAQTALVVLGVVEADPVLAQLHPVVELLRALVAPEVGHLGVLARDVLLELGTVAGHLAEGTDGTAVDVTQVGVHALAVGAREVAVVVGTENVGRVVRVAFVTSRGYTLGLPSGFLRDKKLCMLYNSAK